MNIPLNGLLPPEVGHAYPLGLNDAGQIIAEINTLPDGANGSVFHAAILTPK
ncbi:MAG TPA: hypothetical protein VKU00_24565 [Chthonomonadaceae bacterium]|nr:hypothetical protein [Chthonomonadaceae bacterium]